MAETKTAIANRPIWVDLSSGDAEASRGFYSRLFGWKVEVYADPQYGGYGMAKVGDRQVAGIAPTQSPDAPTAWLLYIGTDDADELARRVQAGGGSVVAPPFDVGDQGRMAVFADPTGAAFSVWQPRSMRQPMPVGEANTFGWAELNSRGIDRAIPFYQRLFGWATKTSDMGAEAPPYTEFQLDGQSVVGGMEMNPGIPKEVPSYWMVYFTVDDVDEAFQKATEASAQEMLAPQEFPGGRFAIVRDPQGAVFGLLRMSQP